MPIAQRDSEVELAAMNGDLARRGTCLCLVWAHPHPYPLIIIILVVIIIFVIFITIIMMRDTRHLFVPSLPSNPLGGPGLFNRKTEKK